MPRGAPDDPPCPALGLRVPPFPRLSDGKGQLSGCGNGEGSTQDGLGRRGEGSPCGLGVLGLAPWKGRGRPWETHELVPVEVAVWHAARPTAEPQTLLPE